MHDLRSLIRKAPLKVVSVYQGRKYSNTGRVNTKNENLEHLQYRVERLVQKVNMSLLCDSLLHRHRGGNIPFAHSDVEHRIRQALKQIS